VASFHEQIPEANGVAFGIAYREKLDVEKTGESV
jgi:hypothetical protein